MNQIRYGFCNKCCKKKDVNRADLKDPRFYTCECGNTSASTRSEEKDRDLFALHYLPEIREFCRKYECQIEMRSREHYQQGEL